MSEEYYEFELSEGNMVAPLLYVYEDLQEPNRLLFKLVDNRNALGFLGIRAYTGRITSVPTSDFEIRLTSGNRNDGGVTITRVNDTNGHRSVWSDNNGVWSKSITTKDLKYIIFDQETHGQISNLAFKLEFMVYGISKTGKVHTTGMKPYDPTVIVLPPLIEPKSPK